MKGFWLTQKTPFLPVQLLFAFLLLITLTPIIHVENGWFNNAVPKYLYFSLLVILLSVVVFAIRHTIQRLRVSFLSVPFFVFLTALCITQFSAHDQLMSLYSTFERMGGFWYHFSILLFFFMYAAFSVPGRYLEKVFVCWVLVAVLIALKGLLFETDYGNIYRMASTLGNASNLAHYLFGSLMLLLLLITPENFRKYYYLFITGGLVLLIGLFFTFSRTSFIGIALAVFTFLLCQRTYSKSALIAHKKSMMLLVAVLALAGGTLGYFYYERLAFSVSNTSTLFDRFRLWRIAWEGFMEKPLLGWGTDNYLYVYEKYHSQYTGIQVFRYDRSHNAFLEWFINGGGLTGVAFLFIWATLLWSIWQTTLSRARKSLLTAWWAGSVLFLFFNIDVLSNWLLLILVSVYVLDHLPDTRVKYLTSRSSIGGTSLIFLVVGILILTQSFYGTAHAWYLTQTFSVSDDPEEKLALVRELEKRKYPANYSMVNRIVDYVYTVQNSELSPEFVNEYTSVVTQFIESERQRRPPSIHLLFNKANFESLVSRHAESINTYLQILRINPGFVPVYVRIGYLYFEQKKYPKALQYFTKAEEVISGTAEAALMMMKIRVLMNKNYDFVKDLDRLPPKLLNQYAYLVTGIFKEADRLPDYLMWIWKGGYTTNAQLKQNVLYDWAMTAYEVGDMNSLSHALRVYTANFQCAPDFTREVLSLAQQGIDPSTKLSEYRTYCADVSKAN